MAKKKKKKAYRGFWRFIKVQIFLILLVGAGIGFYYFSGFGAEISALREDAINKVKNSNEETFRSSQTSLVYDKKGELISVLRGEKDVYYLEFNSIPQYVKSAFISVEDKKFYSHKGVDLKAVLRAAMSLLQDQRISQGGSTITQQLGRNIFLSHEVNWQRKVEEVFIALELEKIYSKNKLLEYYINNIYFSNGYYGIQAASKGYFNAEVSQLSLSQIAFLCAIPNSPNGNDPLKHMENALQRRDVILSSMFEDKMITEQEYAQALREEIALNPATPPKKDYVETYTYYCATRELMRQRGFVFRNTFSDEGDRADYEAAYDALYAECQGKLYTGGYRIYTSIDLDAQEKLQATLDQNLAEFQTVNEEGIYQFQGAAACINNQTGYVEAIVGGRSQEYDGYTLNRAYQSYRQPGSTIKPLVVYTPQLERGYTPDSVVEDAPIPDGPENGDKVYNGKMSLRTAVALSKNTIAWTLFEQLTPDVGLAYLEKMGFTGLEQADHRLPASLGGLTRGVTPVEMASAYSAIANYGKFLSPTCIVRITLADGTPLPAEDREGTRVYEENACRMMTDMLKAVLTEGTAKGKGLARMASAGKTGTTDSNKDGWFVGYTYYYTTSIWIGYDIPRIIPGLSGNTYPAKIWQEYMEWLHQDLEPLDFIPAIK